MAHYYEQYEIRNSALPLEYPKSQVYTLSLEALSLYKRTRFYEPSHDKDFVAPGGVVMSVDAATGKVHVSGPGNNAMLMMHAKIFERNLIERSKYL